MQGFLRVLIALAFTFYVNGGYAQEKEWRKQFELDLKGLGMSAAVGPNGPAISHYDYATGDLLFTEKISGEWQTTSVASKVLEHTNNVPYAETALVFDSSGKANILFYSANSQSLRLAVLDTGTWALSDVDHTVGSGMFVSATNCNNRICICYQRYLDRSLVFGELLSEGWALEVVDDSPADDLGNYCDLKEDALGVLHLVSNQLNPNRLRHQFRIDPTSSWSQPGTVDDRDSRWPQLVPGPAGILELVSSAKAGSDFYSSDTSMLRYALGSTAWSPRSLSAGYLSYVGGHPHGAFDKNGLRFFAARRLMYSALFGQSGSVAIFEEQLDGTYRSTTIQSSSYCPSKAKELRALVDAEGERHLAVFQYHCNSSRPLSLSFYSKVTPPVEPFSFRGNVLDQNYQGISGAIIELEITNSIDGEVRRYVTNSLNDGSYVFPTVLGPGSFEIKARKSGWTFPAFSSHMSSNWNWNLYGEQRTTQIAVKVVSPLGDPIYGVSLRFDTDEASLQKVSEEGKVSVTFPIQRGAQYTLKPSAAGCFFTQSTLTGHALGDHVRVVVCHPS